MRLPWSGLLVLLLGAAGAGCSSTSVQRTLDGGVDFLFSPVEVVALGVGRVAHAPSVCVGSELGSGVVHESVYVKNLEPDGFAKDEITRDSGVIAAVFSVVMVPIEGTSLLLDRLRFALPRFDEDPEPDRIVVESIFKDREKEREARAAREEKRRKDCTVARAVPRPSD